MGLWLVAVVSWRLLDGCWDGCSYLPEAVGLNGNVMPRALKLTPGKMASDLQIPWHNCCCCAIPNFVCSNFPLSGVLTKTLQGQCRHRVRKRGTGDWGTHRVGLQHLRPDVKMERVNAGTVANNTTNGPLAGVCAISAAETSLAVVAVVARGRLCRWGRGRKWGGARCG